jgi:hypothetical protein
MSRKFKINLKNFPIKIKTLNRMNRLVLLNRINLKMIINLEVEILQ